MTVMQWNGIGRSTTARRPAMNYAPTGGFGAAPLPAQLHCPSEAAERIGRRARDHCPTGLVGHESHGPSLETTTNPSCCIPHPLPTIRPSPGSRETGLDTETAAVGTRSVARLAVTVHGQHCAVAGSVAMRRHDGTRRPGGVDVVELLRVVDWTRSGPPGI
jgi:hypothetical protein